ncbi:MAG: ATP-binding protein [Isosphaeraceae bacterium]
MIWQEYWGLSRDPFLDHESAYIPLPEHEEAAARLSYAVEGGRRWALLSGPAGVGKTRVLRRALEQARRPSRRLALVTGPMDGATLYADLAARLGSRLTPGASREPAWQALHQAARVLAVQGLHLVLGVDAAEALLDGPGRVDLLRLALLGEACGGRVTILVAATEEAALVEGPGFEGGPVASLRPLPLSEARHYLEARLAAAGCRDALFSPRGWSGSISCRGTSRGLDRLADALCLMTAAERGLEAVSSEFVDRLAGEPDSASARPFAVVGSAACPPGAATRSG